MRDEEPKARYMLRLLYGFQLETLKQTNDLSKARLYFKMAKKEIKAEYQARHLEAPYMLFLVDALKDEVIQEYTQAPFMA